MPKLHSRLLLALSGAALAAVPGTAFAEGFDGPYVGVDAGLSILSINSDTLTGPDHDKDNSTLVRGVAGYRTGIGSVAGPVLGVEGDVGVVTDGGDMRYGISGIAGIQVLGSSLLYGRVGYGWRDGVERPGGEGIDGLVLGGGFETALAANLHLRADYRHLSYGDFDMPDNTFHFDGHEVTGGVILAF